MEMWYNHITDEKLKEWCGLFSNRKFHLRNSSIRKRQILALIFLNCDRQDASRISIIINYIIFSFHRFELCPETRSGRSLQGESSCLWRCHILRQILGMCQRSTRIVWLPQWFGIRWQTSWCHRRLRLSLALELLRGKTISKYVHILLIDYCLFYAIKSVLN